MAKKALIRDQMIDYYQGITDQSLINLKAGKSFDFDVMTNHSLLDKFDRSLTNLTPNHRDMIERFRRDMNNMSKVAQSDYNHVLTKVNATDDEETKQKIMSDYANNGIKGFTARNGAKWNIETYSNMYTTHWNNEFIRLNLLDEIKDNERVRISSHSDSCPICKPFQDKVYYKYEVPRLRNEGLFHIRCRHHAYKQDIPTTVKININNKTEKKMWKNVNTENLLRKWTRRLLVAFLIYELETCKNKVNEYSYMTS